MPVIFDARSHAQQESPGKIAHGHAIASDLWRATRFKSLFFQGFRVRPPRAPHIPSAAAVPARAARVRAARTMLACTHTAAEARKWLFSRCGTRIAASSAQQDQQRLDRDADP
jgi:hypothetical protein